MVGAGAALVVWRSSAVHLADLADAVRRRARQPAALPPRAPLRHQPARSAAAPAALRRRDAALAAAPAAAAAEASTDPDLEATRAEYEEQLAARPKDPELLNKLGQLLERMGQPEDAAARYRTAVAMSPLEPAYRLNLARAAGALQGSGTARSDQYREAVRLPSEGLRRA